MEELISKSRSRSTAKLGWPVISLVGLGIVLSVLFDVVKKANLVGSPYRDTLNLISMLCLLGSAWIVLRRVYSLQRIVRLFSAGALVLLFTQVMNVIEDIPALDRTEGILRALLVDGYLRELPTALGIGLILVSFYFCLFETDNAKQRLAQHADSLAHQIKERERAESELRRSEENFRVLTETSTAATFIHQGDKFLYANKAAVRFTGYSSDAMLSMRFFDFAHPDFKDVVRERGLARLQDEAPPDRYELAIVTKDGQTRWMDLSVGTIQYEGHPAVLGTFFDITERKHAEDAQRFFEAQVQRTQKLESLGILAGGIAHDFNNLLMGILGNADLALLDLPPASPVRENIEGIENAARRAADLARQMLAYSGKGRFVVEPIDLGAALTEIGNLISASVSKKAALRYNLAPNLPTIEADATQIRQVFMNLITNASEALEDKSGSITVSTGVAECDREYLRETYLDEELPEGTYVFCEVSDTGCGMDAETRGKIFDPFFTTKFTGRGLGLAAVLGIVRGHRGAIRVYSEPGHGTTFKILFPAAGRAARAVEKRNAPVTYWRGKGTILLVDDESTVRRVGKQMLERAGFDVLVAVDGCDALNVFEANADDITCVLLDLTMPNMDGEETFRELRQLKKDLRVILSSGYNEQEAVNRFTESGLAGFIQKPYQYSTLTQKLQEVLETSPQPERIA